MNMDMKKINIILMVIITIALFVSVNKLIAIAFLVLSVLYMNLPNIFYFRGNTKYLKNDTENAFKLYKRAYRMRNSSVKIKINYAYHLLMVGEIDKSEKILRELSTTKLNIPDEINVKLNISLIMWKRNNL